VLRTLAVRAIGEQALAAKLALFGCRGAESMPREPVADRGRAAADAVRDLANRQPILDQLLQLCSFHSFMIAGAADRKYERVFARYFCSPVVSSSRLPSREFFSFARVRDSIWRTRSRVTPTSEPIASRVIGSSEDRP